MKRDEPKRIQRNYEKDLSTGEKDCDSAYWKHFHKNDYGKKQYYHQWYELGRTKSKYIPASEIEKMMQQIAERKELQLEQRQLQNEKREMLDDSSLLSLINAPTKASISVPMKNNRYKVEVLKRMVRDYVLSLIG